mgnify:CR=1 FL=1
MLLSSLFEAEASRQEVRRRFRPLALGLPLRASLLEEVLENTARPAAIATKGSTGATLVQLAGNDRRVPSPSSNCTRSYPRVAYYECAGADADVIPASRGKSGSGLPLHLHPYLPRLPPDREPPAPRPGLTRDGDHRTDEVHLGHEFGPEAGREVLLLRIRLDPGRARL